MKLKRLSVLMLLVLLIIFMNGPSVIGEENSVGKIIEITGPVTIIRIDGQEIMARVERALFAGDQISTGIGGMVYFSFNQGEQFRLGEETQVSIDELSAVEMEDKQPVLRLALGFLWSKIRKFSERPFRTVVHTPTAVVGVRGTEFDTVVSIDGTAVVTVDEDTVELEVEDDKTLVEEGRMTQVNLGEKPIPSVQAIPKENRDWQAWRKNRIVMLLKNLPRMAPKFRKRFEDASNRFAGFTAKIQKTSDDLSREMKKARQAKSQRNRKAYVQSLRHIKEQSLQFKKMVQKFRSGLNRVRVIGSLSHRVEGFAARNKDRYTKEERAVVRHNLGLISQERAELKTIIQQTVSKIRRTFKELREFR